MLRLFLLSTLPLGLQGEQLQGDLLFEEYRQDFGKTYEDATEYESRRAIFRDNLAAAEQHNREQQENDGNAKGYKLGVNQYSDLLLEEVPLGYVKTYHLGNVAAGRRLANAPDLESIFRTEPVSDLPKHVDWRTKSITTPVKNQYYCGSCWAFASTAVLESHVAHATGTLFALSEQELVSCAGNPLHCGGTGGCQGSTAELAMEYARTHGMVDEWAFGYQSNHGANVSCTLKERGTTTSSSPLIRGSANQDQKKYLKGAVAAIDGWMTLPRNNYTAVMNGIAKLGPLSVAVACHPWLMYKSGVYSGNLKTKVETDVRIRCARSTLVCRVMWARCQRTDNNNCFYFAIWAGQSHCGIGRVWY